MCFAVEGAIPAYHCLKVLSTPEPAQTASLIASEMRAGLEATLGYTSCAGIAYEIKHDVAHGTRTGVSTTMLLAKLACELHKPNQQTVLLPQVRSITKNCVLIPL
jgi:nucleotidyltransferase/DNA polymerase involved in DNA repair